MSSNLSHLLSVARGDAAADLLLTGGRIVNVFSGQVERADIAIAGERIAGVGAGYASAKNIIDLAGAFVAPGLIDAHVHIESSLCIPQHFASAIVPRGVTSVVADPHEIANVAGAAGVRFMAGMAQSAAARIAQMAPSCVPATDMGTSGAALDAADLAELLRDGVVHGLAEVMNFPAVVGGEASMLAKLRAFAGAPFAGRPIDGHCPNLRGHELNAYIAAGIGSEHECTTVDEAGEKLARGMYILIREATNARNLDALIPLITPANSRRICLCTDDRTPIHLLDEGSVDEMLRRVMAAGVEPVEAFRLVTLNPCEWFGLHDRGAIAPGRLADLFVFDDLKAPAARRVFVGGREIGAIPVEPPSIPAELAQSCRVDIDSARFAIPARGPRVRVIGSLPDQLITESRLRDAIVRDGHVVADPSRDLLKIAVIERHRRTGNVGVGFIEGIGLKRGAIAGTVAHDHHNLIVIGCDDDSMTTAARAVASSNGGLAAAIGETVIAALPLPVAGLMSDRPIGQVRDAYAKLLAVARNEVGSAQSNSMPADPFMTMSFMGLEVIPSLKITDQGPVDVAAFAKVDLFA